MFKKMSKGKSMKKRQKKAKLSRSAMVDLMRESKGRFMGCTYKTSKGVEVTYNFQVKQSDFQDKLGNIILRTRGDGIKKMDPKKIVSLTYGGQVYWRK